MPRDPPVTSATRPRSENRSVNMRPSFDFEASSGRERDVSQEIKGQIYLSRVDATKAVPQRGRGARGEHRQDPFLLVVAVERNPRQRGRIFRVVGKDHARTRRYRRV